MSIEVNQISIDLNGAEQKKEAKASVQTAMDGRTYSKAYEVTTDCNVHKEMERTGVYTKNRNVEEKDSKDAEQAKALSYFSEFVTGADVASLAEEPTPLEEYSSSQFDRAIRRIKKQRAETKESVEQRAAKFKEQENAQKETAIRGAVEGTSAEHMVEILSSADFPATPELAERLCRAVEMGGGLSESASVATKELINSGEEITPGQVLRCTSIRQPSNFAEKTGFEQVKEQAKVIAAQSGCEPEKAIESARWLFENDVPVTAENIRKHQGILELQKLKPEVLTERIIDEMIDGVAPESANLLHISRKEASVVREDLLSVTEDELLALYPEELKAVTAKRQLEEIRLKLTVDATRTLYNKGIQIDTSHLEEVVEALRQQEKQMYEGLCKEAKVEAPKEKAITLRDTMDMVKQIQSSPAAVLGKTLEEGMTQTLPEMEANCQAVGQTVNLEQVYETVGTQVRTDLGDSIKKAFGNIDELLGELELPMTEANQRAVRILAYNRMEVSRENIAEVKEYDSKVNSLMSKMTPDNVLRMIREQVNPLEVSMDELSHLTDQYIEESGVADESYSKFLWKLDKQQSITAEERKSFIGIYRLMDKVEKSDGAVVGSLVNQGREVTFRSLLEAVRTRRKGSLEAEVDDGFGGLEQTIAKGDSISDQITAAYADKTVSAVKQTLSPELLRSLGQEIMDMPLTQLEEQLMHVQSENKAFYEQMAEEIVSIRENSGEAGEFLRRLEMPDTLANLRMAKAYLESGLRKELPGLEKEDADAIEQAFEDKEVLEQTLSRIEERQTQELENQIQEKETYEDVRTLQQICQSLSFNGKLRKQEIYEIPLVTEDGVLSLNVTVRQKSKADESGVVEISMESEAFGKIQAVFRIHEEQVSGFVTGETGEALDGARELMSMVSERLTEQGYEVEETNYAQGKRTKKGSSDLEYTPTSVRSLYEVAKIFIACARTAQNGGTYENQ